MLQVPYLYELPRGLLPGVSGPETIRPTVSMEGSIALTDSLEALSLGAPPGSPMPDPSFPHPKLEHDPLHPMVPQETILKEFNFLNEEI